MLGNSEQKKTKRELNTMWGLSYVTASFTLKIKFYINGKLYDKPPRQKLDTSLNPPISFPGLVETVKSRWRLGTRYSVA